MLDLLPAIVPWVLLLVALVGAVFTINAFVPARRSKWLLVPSFFFAMFAAELAAYHLAWQAVAIGGLVALGGLSSWPGWVGVGMAGATWLGLLYLVVQGRRAVGSIRAALADVLHHPLHLRIQWWRVLIPFPLRLSKTRVVRNIEYARVAGQRLRLDVYLPPKAGEHRPAIVQIHGGAWIVGDKREQGVPLMTRLSDRGFVGFNVNYRLSPGATFPEHLIDIKRAIAWIREHADEYGVDPSFIAVTGGSAGGHLAALTGLTIGDPRYQPGFEDADTSVQCVIPFYAIYDFTDRNENHSRAFLRSVLEPLVMKAFLDEEREKFEEASPIDRIHPDAPPFFVIHGDRDTLAPLADARDFVDKLRAVSKNPVVYAEIPGAQHSFDLFVSPRSLPVIEGVGCFVETFVEARASGPAPGAIRSDRATTGRAGFS